MKKHRFGRCLVVAVAAIFAIAMVAGVAMAETKPAAKPAAKPVAKPAPKPMPAVGNPQAVIEAWFKAAAAGDMAKLKSLSTGAAMKNVEKSAKKKGAVAKLKFFGSTYQSVKVNAKKKTAVVTLDAAKLKSYFESQAKTRLAKITDKKKQEQMKKFMDKLIPQLVKRMTNLNVKLAQVKGKWLVADISAQ